MGRHTWKVRVAAVSAAVIALGAAGAGAAHGATPQDETASAAAYGRGTGSGSYGFIGRFGAVNNTDQAIGAFNHPYGIDVDPRDGTSLVVADSGNASWEGGSKASGHSVQWISRTADFDPLRGQYLGNGEYRETAGAGAEAETAFGANYEFTQIWDGRLGARGNSGARGVAVQADGSVAVSTPDAAGGPAMKLFTLSSAAQELNSFGYWTVGRMSWNPDVEVDSRGNIYTPTFEGETTAANKGSVSVFSADGTFIARYITGNEVPGAHSVAIGREDGEIVEVFVATATGKTFGGTVHLKKFLVDRTPQAGQGNDPQAWTWTLDPTFSVPNWSSGLGDARATFALDYNPVLNELYRAPKSGPIQRYDATTGALLGTIGNGASTALTDGTYSLVRGIAADADGYVFTTMQTGATDPSRAAVQVFALTPAPVTGLSAEASVEAITLSWDALPIGAETPYGQAPLRDYVVEYRPVGAEEWEISGMSEPSTEPERVITGLVAGTEYEFRVTAFNEAGSGDPSEIVAVAPVVAEPAISLALTGNGVRAQTAAEAYTAVAGTTLEFEYEIVNVGNVPVEIRKLSDSALGDIEAPAGFAGVLDPEGGSTSAVTFTSSAALPLGEYQSTARVEWARAGVDEALEPVTDAWFGVGAKKPVVDPPVDPPVDPKDPADPKKPNPPVNPGGEPTQLAVSGGEIPLIGLAAGVILVASASWVLLARRGRETALARRAE